MNDAPPGSASAPVGLTALLVAQPWIGFVAPFAIFMAAGSFEPTADKPFELAGLSIPYSAYPIVYTIKILLTLAAMAAVWPTYRQFPLRLSPLAVVVGAVGVFLWVGLCKLELENTLLTPLGLDWLTHAGDRSAFNPHAHWPDRPLLAYGFLAIRFFGLAAVVPVIEEFFVRGFVMRFAIDADWSKIPFGTLTPVAVAVGTILCVMMHPAEAIAAAVWFTSLTWLMFTTKNIWDCVVAHAVTNLLLGIYVVVWSDWRFW